MAKARSRRTLRNRKSRNRRGGGVELENFRQINALNDNDKLCNFVQQMIDTGKKDILINELSENEKQKFNECEQKIDEENKNDFLPKKIVKQEKKIVKQEEEENPLPPRIRPPASGGKSRRRHRRGRTLHKRRKSRKVRKTRCRRK